MVYIPTIPAATDNPSQSQPQILANFTALNTVYGNGAGLVGDHVPFNVSTNQGNHVQVTLPSLTTPGAGPGAGKIVEYSQTNTGITMPYYQRDAINTQFPISPIKAYGSFVTPGNGANVAPLDSFNISGNIAQTWNTNYLSTFTVNLTNAMRTTVYGIIGTMGFNTLTSLWAVQYQIVSASQFLINVLTFPNTTAVPNGVRITFMAMES